jgi:ribosomal protein S18 acetylase RimI-like enzyme
LPTAFLSKAITTIMIAVRDAQYADYIAIAQLHAESWRQTYRGIYSDAFLDHEVEQDRAIVWQDRLSLPTSQQQVIVALHNDTLVGFACLFLDTDPKFGSLLDNLHITLSFQKSGIGKRLLQECARRIGSKSKSPKMYLWVYESNENARRVYEQLGAVHIATEEQPTASGVSAPACRYAWTDVAVLLS